MSNILKKLRSRKLDLTYTFNLLYYDLIFVFLLIGALFSWLSLFISLLYYYKFNKKMKLKRSFIIFSIFIISIFIKKISVIKNIEHTGIVTNVREVGDTYDYELRVYNNKYLFYSSNEYKRGDLIKVRGSVVDFKEESHKFDFNLKTYYYSKNIRGRIYINNIERKNNTLSFMFYQPKASKYLIINILNSIFFNYSNDENLDLFNKLNISFLISLSGIHILAILFLVKKGMFYLNIDQIMQEKVVRGVRYFICFLQPFSIISLRYFIKDILYYLYDFLGISVGYFNTHLLIFLIILIFFPHYSFSSSYWIIFIILTSVYLIDIHYDEIYIKKQIYFQIILQVVLFPFINEFPFYFIIISIVSYGLVFYFLGIGLFHVIFYKFRDLINKLIQYTYHVFEFLIEKNPFSNIKFAKLNNELIVFYFFFLFLSFMFKNKLKRLVFIILSVLIVVVNVTKLKYVTPSIYFLDVGQGDTTIYLDNKCVIVIDSFKKANTFLKSKGINKIDYLILTHSDNDHVMEANTLIKTFKVENILLNKYDEYNLVNYSNVLYPNTLDSFSCGNARFAFLNFSETDFNDANQNSLVLMLEVNNNNILLTGDIDKKIEEMMVLEYGDLLKADILKLAHHGSKTSSSDLFLKTVNPLTAVLSYELNNRYNIPGDDVLQRLKTKGIKSYHTALDKTIEIKLLEEAFYIKKYKKPFYLSDFLV